MYSSHVLCSHTDPADSIQANGLPEEHQEPPMEESSYPDVEEEENIVTDTYQSSSIDLEQPKTWASRLSQGIPSGGGKVVVVPSAPSPPAPKLPSGGTVSDGGVDCSGRGWICVCVKDSTQINIENANTYLLFEGP